MAELSPARPHPGLSLLLERRSSHALSAPAPNQDALATLLRAARRVPDFQQLHPYRFIVAVEQGLERLSDIFHQAALAAGKPEAIVNRARRLTVRAPMIIIAVASPKPSMIVPVFEQQMSAACTVMAMQMAAQALGYGGIWRSGWVMHDRHVQQALGLVDTEQIVGFLYLGTPATAHVPVAESPEKAAPQESEHADVIWL